MIITIDNRIKLYLTGAKIKSSPFVEWLLKEAEKAEMYEFCNYILKHTEI